MHIKGINIQKPLAEFVGTFALVFFGCGSIMVANYFSGGIDTGMIPLIFGLVVMAVIYAIGHISGAHINPAVTIAFAVARHFPRKQVLLYVISQFLGGIVAVGILAMLLPDAVRFGATVPVVGLVSAFFWELILTFFLMFVIISVATDTRAEGMMAGIAIGAAVTIGAFVGGAPTGGSMNPARSLAPAIFEGRMNVVWIYLTAPVLGAILGALVYQKIRCATTRASETGENENHKKDVGGCC